MGIKYLDDAGPDGCGIRSGTTLTIKSGGIVDFASGSYFKLAGTAVYPAVGVAAGYKVARGTAAVTTSLEVATGLATVVNATACLIDDPNITASSVTVAASTTAGNILLKTWSPTATNNATPAAATKTNVSVAWIAVGT